MFKTLSHRHREGAKPLWVGSRRCDDNVTEGDEVLGCRGVDDVLSLQGYGVIVTDI